IKNRGSEMNPTKCRETLGSLPGTSPDMHSLSHRQQFQQVKLIGSKVADLKQEQQNGHDGTSGSCLLVQV
ncbi:MAG: hypothetical protein Q8904_16235, partial [Bacteroidota bacterium]|nr:hypothetical protein [Bacteroidota bacterium]